MDHDLIADLVKESTYVRHIAMVTCFISILNLCVIYWLFHLAVNK